MAESLHNENVWGGAQQWDFIPGGSRVGVSSQKAHLLKSWSPPRSTVLEDSGNFRKRIPGRENRAYT